jgi:hypothetical protein
VSLRAGAVFLAWGFGCTFTSAFAIIGRAGFGRRLGIQDATGKSAIGPRLGSGPVAIVSFASGTAAVRSGARMIGWNASGLSGAISLGGRAVAMVEIHRLGTMQRRTRAAARRRLRR